MSIKSIPKKSCGITANKYIYFYLCLCIANELSTIFGIFPLIVILNHREINEMHTQSRRSLKRNLKENIKTEEYLLAPDLPKATKDCRVCNRRRIKCDRTTPSCKKCAAKKLTCSGYGINLTWEWGVASRGKLAGKKVPVLSPVGTSSPQATRKSSILVSSCEKVGAEHNDMIQNQSNPCIPSQSLAIKSEHREPRSHHHGLSKDSTDTKTTFSSQQSLWSPIFAMSGPTSGILQGSASRRRLFHHYGQIITGSMVWVDVPDNPWRNIIMPMALQSTPLLISVLALSAEHLSAVLPEHSVMKNTLMRCASEYRNAALTLLASDMRSAAISSEAIPTTKTVASNKNKLSNSVLASMLILCNMETVRPDSRLWRVHLDAARTIVDLRRCTPSSNDEIFDFLVQQFFITDVFACTTSFVQIDDHDILTDDAGSVFIEFLRLIRRVTWLERLTTSQGIPISGAGISSFTLRKLFEQARDRTLTLSIGTPFTTTAEREQYLGIVDSFHYAGLLYGYRCLSYSNAEEDISKSREALFHNLNLVESDKPAFAQDVVWPLFIAGTEAESADGTRNLVEQKLQQAMKSTGFSNCMGALAFLKALWLAKDGGENCFGFPDDNDTQRGTDGTLNWIQCARSWTNHRNQFLVF